MVFECVHCKPKGLNRWYHWLFTLRGGGYEWRGGDWPGRGSRHRGWKPQEEVHQGHPHQLKVIQGAGQCESSLTFNTA